jgi:hypothetical protein
MKPEVISRRTFIGKTGAVVSGLTVLSDSVMDSINPQGSPDDPEVKENTHNELNGPAFSSGKPDEQDLPPVYAAYYAHCGIILWGLKGLKSILETQYTNLERFPDYRCGWDHEAYTYDYLAENDPKTLIDMVDALKRFSGRLGVGSSTYGQPLSAFIDGESNIRQLTFAMDTTEKHLGYPISVYIMSEHPFHPQLPQLLFGAGFKGAILRTHFSMYGHNPSCDAPVVWWSGVDSSQILALPTYPFQDSSPVGKYSRVPGWGHTIDSSFLGGPPTEERKLKVASFRSRFGPGIRPLVISHADDGAGMPAEAGEEEKVSRDWQHILIEDIPRLLPHPRVSLHTGANDFSYRMPWGYCGNWMWNSCREAEVRIETAERLAAIGFALGESDCEQELKVGWKNLLVSQHHDIQICGLEKDARKFLDAALTAADNVTNRILAAITPRIGQAGQGRRSVVFNPLPWARTEYLSDIKGDRLLTVPGLGFMSVEEKIPGTVSEKDKFKWEPESHFSGPLPHIWKSPVSDQPLSWESRDPGRLLTPYYEVLTAPEGGFWILRDRESGQNMLAPPKTSGTLSALIDGQECESVGRLSDPEVKDDRVVLSETVPII